MTLPNKKILVVAAVLCVAAIAAYSAWSARSDNPADKGLARGNGRLEATEIYISTKLAGRVDEILVEDGDYVEADQLLAVMNTDTLQAQLNEAQAQYQQMISNLFKAQAQVAVRESDKAAAQAQVAQRASELDGASRRLTRSAVLSARGALDKQQFDNDETSRNGARAAVTAAQAQVTVANAAIEAAKADVVGAEYNVKAAQATINRIQADIDDSRLTAPRAGRVQYRIVQPGEVLAGGGKVLNMADLNDVYMIFFLPEQAAGRMAVGQEVRLVLDAAPDYYIPASISYVSSTAQFTPKTVETEEERQKLMFRVKAQVSPDLLSHYRDYVKVGLPGVAWVRIAEDGEWPDLPSLLEALPSGPAGSAPAPQAHPARP